MWRAAGRGNQADPLDHCCINVALYGLGPRRGFKRWTMTERGKRHVGRSDREFVVGPSQLRWNGQSLLIDLCEVGAPVPHRVVGQVVVHPDWLSPARFALDEHARHHWGPIAPMARVEVRMQHPALSWQGHAYLDSNCGSEPLNKPVEPAFSEWDWSRTALPGERCAVVYDVRQSGQNNTGADRLLALQFHRDGVEPFEAPGRHPLPRTGWRVRRAMRADEGPTVVQTLEDTPFYSRSVLQTTLQGHAGLTMHESLSVPRLTSWLVQSMLPWKMPRVA